MRYTVRPISDRILFAGKHRRSPFKASWSTTERLLCREVEMLAGRHLVVECDVTESDIRIDGGLYARARPASPAVRVAFDSRHGPLVYATDRFTHWTDNVRAIALGLEALRRVDRYAITESGQQYTGFKAIEAASAGMGTEAAARLLERLAIGDEGDQREASVRIILKDRDAARRCWRDARATAHPDRRDGDHALWHQVEQAARVLGLDGA